MLHECTSTSAVTGAAALPHPHDTAACSRSRSGPGNYRGVVNVDGIGFALDAESGPETPSEELPEEDLVNAGDVEWLEAEITRDVEEAASIGLRVDRDDETIRCAYQLGDDGRWHRSPTIPRFVEIDQALKALRLMPAYTASSCRPVTVLAEHSYAKRGGGGNVWGVAGS